jgi:hypothetical protein
MTSRFVEPEPPHAYSFLGDLSLLPQLLSAIPNASTARTALVRAGPLEPLLAEGLARGAGNQVFGERLDTTARSLNDYFVYFLACPFVRTTTSSTSRRDRSCDCTANIFLHRHSSATSSKASRIACLFQPVTAQPVPLALVPPWGTY